MNADPPSPDAPDDNPLRQELDATEGTPATPRDQTTETLTHTPTRMPKRIGRYHIKSVIASGGMGTVYEAVQEKPHRTVALKLMRHGIASRSALRRFEYESQILARLRHPGIAQVYEAGTHRDDSGTVPYFAMEYIVGAKPINQYAEHKKLATRQKLELFAQVCDAVHHGHQKGIIHRDLKPSNILVDAQQQVKIIDFGVARSTDSDLAVTTLQTDIGQLIGTLQYMSPEQCEADPHNIDTRSDVYALGVVLYELLSGRLPYKVSSQQIFEATRTIREQQPTKLTTIDKSLKGDLETVVLKALEKDRERRYQSASDFAQDIRRYLGNEAITARPPSIVYQFRVLVRRNKPVFAAIAAVFVVLVGGVIVSTSMYLRSEANRVKAESEATKAQTTLDFLEGMFQSVDPNEGGGGDVKFMLDQASEKIESGALAELPRIEASVRHILGSAYKNLTLIDACAPHLLKAFDIRRRLLGDENPDTLRSASTYSELLFEQGKYQQAETLRRQTLHTRTRVLGREHPDTLRSANRLATMLFSLGKYQEATVIIRPTLEAQRRILGPEHPHTLNSAYRLASSLNGLGDVEEAERMHREVLAARRRTVGDERTGTIWSMNNLGVLLMQRGKLVEAERMFRDGLEISRRRFGDRHKTTLFMMDNLTGALFRRGKMDEADVVSKESLELHLAVFGERNKATLEAMAGRASVHRELGRLTESEELFQRVLKLRRDVLGEEHPQTIGSLGSLAQVLAKQGKPEEARPYFAEQSRHLRREAEEPDANANDLNEYAMLLLTCELENLRDARDALPLAKRAVEMDAGENFETLDTLALAFFMTGDLAKAIETQEKAVSLLPPDKSTRRTEIESNLAKFRQAAKNETPD